MKTTVDLPDPLFRRAKATAAERGMSLKSFITRAVEQSLAHCAWIADHLKRKGRPIPQNDMWTAALARQHALAVLSRDGHFDFIDWIERLDW